MGGTMFESPGLPFVVPAAAGVGALLSSVSRLAVAFHDAEAATLGVPVRGVAGGETFLRRGSTAFGFLAVITRGAGGGRGKSVGGGSTGVMMLCMDCGTSAYAGTGDSNGAFPFNVTPLLLSLPSGDPRSIVTAVFELRRDNPAPEVPGGTRN